MAEQDDEIDDAAEETGGGKKKMIIIIVAALVVLGVGGGAAAYFMGLFGGEEVVAEETDETSENADAEEEGKSEESEDEAQTAEESDAADDGGEGEGNQIVFVTVPDVLVNLNSGGKRMRFLKLKVALETANAEIATEVEALMPRIMDSFQIYLRALSIDEVRGSVGLAQLKDELIARVNHAVHPARVDDILVREMLVQ